MVTQLLDTFNNGFVIGRDNAAIAVTTQDLGRVETETTRGTQTTNTLATDISTVGLGSIFNNSKAMLFGGRVQFNHTCRMTKDMYRHNGPGLVCDLCLYTGRINREAIFQDVGKQVAVSITILVALDLLTEADRFGSRARRRWCIDFTA